MQASVEPTSFSAEEYFATQPPPSSLEDTINSVREFVARQAKEGRNVVLVTSGGTTVPLELNVVRFLDNFSAGTRGATSAEYFLKAGYAVIFMHRQFSLQPFSRHYSHSTNPFLDFLEIEPSNDGTTSAPDICVTREMRQDLLEVLTAYKSVQAAGTLHTLTFVTVNDYLWLLRAVTKELSVLGKRAMYYLAAAVSDFFLPRQKLSEHKIQSGKGSLHIEMDQVPKILKPMVVEWTKGEGFIVSFKLETDEKLLAPKARAALERYGHQVVIGNDLNHRKYEVLFVERKFPPPASTGPAPEPGTPEKESPNSNSSQFVETWLRIPVSAATTPNPTTHKVKEIEEEIVAELVKRHVRWIEGGR
ncbi:putative DNA / pantothenate metabolism flavoprotein [Lyophyllum shimeji]|uniref:DNA / pantothenate metabolism flavoprotein n=1 Tax=Lyophyllum shimeji TaxID=47721 RepID=A0A9P3UNX0_LYOSH|nr:putative DNA / pantothenate metabolism flavoprotein [Lyophyllum shimeji]